MLPLGLSRGSIAEICGRRSSGRTSVYIHVLAQATANGEFCAVIDAGDSFHPASAHAAGIDLERLVWVRSRRKPKHAIRAADLIVHAGGFGVVVLDLCEISLRLLHRIPLSYWYRFRHAVEHTPSILLVCARSPQAKSCSSVVLDLQSKRFEWSGKPPFELVRGVNTSATLLKGPAARSKTVSIQAVA